MLIKELIYKDPYDMPDLREGEFVMMDAIPYGRLNVDGIYSAALLIKSGEWKVLCINHCRDAIVVTLGYFGGNN